jgi:hypothetical protein
MPNPIPPRFRRPLSNVVLFVLVYLSLTALHAMFVGKLPFPPTFALVGFAIGSMIAVWVKAAKENERV